MPSVSPKILGQLPPSANTASVKLPTSALGWNRIDPPVHLEQVTKTSTSEAFQQNNSPLWQVLTSPYRKTQQIQEHFIRGYKNDEYIPLGLVVAAVMVARTVAIHTGIESFRYWTGREQCAAPIGTMAAVELGFGLVGIRCVPALT